jgi:undecaprenyl-diphosphatase
MGLFQAVSLLPGISRGGATLAGGVLAGGRPETVVRFSFLMSIPAILGSLVLHLRDLAQATEGADAIRYAVGFGAACLRGLAAIQLLLCAVARRRIYLFAVYGLLVDVAGGMFLGGR